MNNGGTCVCVVGIVDVAALSCVHRSGARDDPSIRPIHSSGGVVALPHRTPDKEREAHRTTPHHTTPHHTHTGERKHTYSRESARSIDADNTVSVSVSVDIVS